jgi:hypothetical protein
MMIRNAKAMGLALVAMLAIGAMSASAASAEVGEFTAEEYPASMTAVQIEGGHSFTTAAGTLTCENAHFEGTLPAAQNDLNVTPEYTGCEVETGPLAGAPVTVTNNGCTYTFTVTTTVIEDTAEGLVHLICGSTPMQVHIYANHTKHTNGEILCTYTIGSQTINNIHYENHTPEVVTVEARGSTVAIQRDGSILCGAANQNATYNGNTETTATNEEGEAIGGHVG